MTMHDIIARMTPPTTARRILIGELMQAGGRRIRRKVLARQFGVSEPAIKRDLCALRRAGIEWGGV